MKERGIIESTNIIEEKELMIAKLVRELEKERNFNQRVSGNLSNQKQVISLARDLQEEALKDKEQMQ